MAISHSCTGMTFCVLSDHRGAPISAIQSTSKEVRQAQVTVGRDLGCCGQAADSHIPHFSQYGDLGVEGVELWLAASGDQRVSIWVSDWLRDRCELLEWLSFPAPAVSEVRVPWACGWGLESAQLSTTYCCPQAPGLLPPCLAAFCPWDKAILVCVGLGAHEEVVFYSLRQKQVCVITAL